MQWNNNNRIIKESLGGRILLSKIKELALKEQELKAELMHQSLKIQKIGKKRSNLQNIKNRFSHIREASCQNLEALSGFLPPPQHVSDKHTIIFRGEEMPPDSQLAKKLGISHIHMG
jgi:hypothetical protein